MRSALWALGLVLIAVLLAPGATGRAAVPTPASSPFDSRFVGESAFLTISPGGVAGFVVLFQNTGSMTWVTGTPSEMVLMACLDDKVTCGVSPEESEWDLDWPSSTVYARQEQSAVLPGEIATFVYQVRAPLGAVPGVYRFNGEVALASTLVPIHAEGYYHEASILPPAPTPTPSPTPIPSATATPTPTATSGGGGSSGAATPTPTPSPPPPPPPLPPPVPPPQAPPA